MKCKHMCAEVATVGKFAIFMCILCSFFLHYAQMHDFYFAEIIELKWSRKLLAAIISAHSCSAEDWYLLISSIEVFYLNDSRYFLKSESFKNIEPLSVITIIKVIGWTG